MSGQIFLSKEAFLPCESHPAACDFGLLYAVNLLSVIRTGGRAFMVMGKVSKKERCRHVGGVFFPAFDNHFYVILTVDRR